MSTPSVDQRVLYVEDNPANVALMERLFKERPMIELEIAPDGASARHLAVEHHPQLVLMDVNLPDTSGDELITQLKNDMQELTPPIVVVSAEALPSVVDRLTSLGIVEFVTKPYDIQHLFDIVDTYCCTQ